MENRELIFKDWILDGVDSQSRRSTVYRARREEFGETLHAVVKESRISCPDPEERARLRAAAESRMKALCALGNVSTLLVPDEFVITDEDDGFTVHTRMEACTRLAVHASVNPLTEQELTMMGIDLCTALDALDKRGLRHGDIRPEHIFISKKGDFKLGGFDRLPPEPPAQTPEVSSAAYMAPEVYKGGPFTAKAELYALGMVLYRTLNGGRMPFTPPAPATVSVQDRVDATARRMNGEALPRPASGGDGLCQCLSKACVADPAVRYPNALAMRDALQRVLRGAGAAVPAAAAVAAAGVGVQSQAAPVRTPAAQKTETPEKTGKSRRRLGLWILIPAILLVVGAVALAATMGVLPGLGQSQTTTTATTTTAATTTAATSAAATTVTTTTTAATTTTTATTEATTTATTEPPREDFLDVLAQSSTTLDPSQKNRTTNVRLACEFVNGTILEPGEEFSYNKIVGPRTYERGFLDAKIYTAGEIVDGLGGGICQVSSTLYMAAIRADLEITERRNHRFTVAYTPLGEDATVVYGSVDFRFVNNTDYPVRVDCVLDGNTVTVTFCGTQTVENKRVEIETKVLSKDPYETVEIVDETLAPGERKVKNSSGHSGYKTETYRVVYIDDVEVSRERENKSTYTRLDKSYLVGPEQTTTAATTGDITQPPEWLDPSATTAAPDPIVPVVPDPAVPGTSQTADTALPVQTTTGNPMWTNADGSPSWLG